MGVEHALYCKKCHSYVDGHKCWTLYFSVIEDEVWSEKKKEFVPARPPTWEDIEKNNNSSFDLYWTIKMFAFLWKHKDHGAEIVWILDSSEEYFDCLYGEDWEFDEDYEKKRAKEEFGDEE